jgi:hypothetical protein
MTRKKIITISSCYECPNRDKWECECLLNNSKRHPVKNIPKWCPLPDAIDWHKKYEDLLNNYKDEIEKNNLR